MVLQNNYFTLEFSESLMLAKDALDRAASIGYMPSEYWSTLELYHHNLSAIDPSEITLAESSYQKALEHNDNNISAHLWYASLLSEGTFVAEEVSSISLLEQAIQLNQMALKLDPKNRIVNGNYNINLVDTGQLARALENLKRLTVKDPYYPHYKSLLARVHYLQGNFSESSRWIIGSNSSSASTAFNALELLMAMNNDSLSTRFFDNIEAENPAYERIRIFESAFNLSKTELIGRAQVTLLQPDFDNWSRAIARALYYYGEFEWSKKLQENVNLEWEKETPRFRLNGKLVVNYISVSYPAGDTERAMLLATRALNNNRERVRLSPNGKWIDDATYYMVLQRPEEAITEIESAFQDGYRHYYLNVHENPIFDSIAADPRMKQIKRKTDVHISRQIKAVEANFIQAGLIAPIPLPSTF